MNSLGSDASVADVVDVAVRSSVERLLAHEDGVRRGGEAEDVHQARVATRRLRSDLRTFGDFVVESWATDLRAELRWLGSELGEIRDIEVMLERLRADRAGLPTTEQEGAERVVRRLVVDWDRARDRIVDTLAGSRYETLRTRLVAAAEHPRCTTWANLRAADMLPPIVRRRDHKVRRAVEALGEHPADEALHAVRIQAKRARYAAEATIPVFGKDAVRYGKAVAKIQDVLGEHQDAVVARAWLTKTAGECPPDDAFAAGMLAAIEARAAEVARAEFPAVWKQAGASRLRSWL